MSRSAPLRGPVSVAPGEELDKARQKGVEQGRGQRHAVSQAKQRVLHKQS